MYATLAEYQAYFGEITEADYNRYGMEATRYLDTATTGIDNVKKLAEHFPTDQTDAAMVKYCACELVHLLKQIADIESMGGYTTDENGVRGKVVSSKSAGNESVSFIAGEPSPVERAARSTTEKQRFISSRIKLWLSGIEDANGVNLLYMGVYPDV